MSSPSPSPDSRVSRTAETFKDRRRRRTRKENGYASTVVRCHDIRVKGEMDQIEKYAKRVVDIVRANEPQIIAFNIFLNEDATESIRGISSASPVGPTAECSLAPRYRPPRTIVTTLMGR